MHWKIQIVNISITRDMVSHIRGRYDCISEFWRKFHEMQILRLHISACENVFDLKFWG